MNNIKFFENSDFALTNSVYYINIFFFNFLKILNIIFFFKKNLNDNKFIKNSYVYKKTNNVSLVLFKKIQNLLLIDSFNYSTVNYFYESDLL